MALRNNRIFLAVAAALLPSPALPAIVTASFSGIIADGNDATGYFVPGQADLTTFVGGAGTPFISGTFSYDTEAGQPDGLGGYANSDFAEWLGFTLKIAGTSYAFGVSDGSFGNSESMYLEDGPDQLVFSLSRSGADSFELIAFDLTGAEFLSGTGLPTEFTYQNEAGSRADLVIEMGSDIIVNAKFMITCASTDPTVCPTTGSDGGDGGDGNAVPEPATWLSLALGFAALGGCLRGQRKRMPQKA